MVFVCILLCGTGLTLHALGEPKMLRFAKLPQHKYSSILRIGCCGCLFLAFVLPLWFQPVTAIFLWAGTFSTSALVVALSWAVLARYRELTR